MGKNLEPGTENQGYSYRNLILWQKAQELTVEVVKIVSRLPQDLTAHVVARQIVRSASSITANIAEGHGRYTVPAHRNHLSIAKGSACETDSWLDVLRRAGHIDPDVEERLHSACEENRMLTAKIRQLERIEQSRRRFGDGSLLYSVEDYDRSARF